MQGGGDRPPCQAFLACDNPRNEELLHAKNIACYPPFRNASPWWFVSELWPGKALRPLCRRRTAAHTSPAMYKCALRFSREGGLLADARKILVLTGYRAIGKKELVLDAFPLSCPPSCRCRYGLSVRLWLMLRWPCPPTIAATVCKTPSPKVRLLAFRFRCLDRG